MQKADDVQRLLSVLRDYTTFGHWFPADLARITVRTLEGLLEERDAAVDDIPRACGFCTHYNADEDTCGYQGCCYIVSGINTGWEWRGVQREG